MTLPNRKGWLAILFIIFCLSIPFAIMYYMSTPKFKTKYAGWQKNNSEAGIPSESKVSDQRMILIKDQRVTIGKTGLVFKGVKNSRVQLDLYLLELDREKPYLQTFSDHPEAKPIRLGDISCKLESVKANVLTMEIASIFRTD